VALLITDCVIFWHIEAENRHIFHCISTPSGGTPCSINVIYTSLKSPFSGLKFSPWQYRSIIICLAVVGSQNCQVARNSEKNRIYLCSKSSKVIDFGANRKQMFNFLLVINSNFGRICRRFRDIDA